MNEPRNRDASRGVDTLKQQRIRTVIALSNVGVGIFVVVSLLHYRYVLGGLGDPGGLLQGSVVWLHRSFGFVPVLLSFGLIAMWGAIAFLRSDGYFPWRRVGASIFFGFALSIMTALLGGHGGTLGGQVSARWTGLFGEAFVFVVLLVMVILSLLLATDWFFVRFLDRGQEESERRISPELSFAGSPTEALPDPQPGPAARSQGAATQRPELAIGQSQLVDQAVAGARSELEERRRVKPSHVSPGSPSPAAGREERRARRMARLAAQRRAAADGRESLAQGGIEEDALVDEIEQVILAERGEVLAPDFDADPFADLDDDELLAKAGLALDELLAEELGGDAGLGLEKSGEAAAAEAEAELRELERSFAEEPAEREASRRRDPLERRVEELGREVLAAERGLRPESEEVEDAASGAPGLELESPEAAEPEPCGSDSSSESTVKESLEQPREAGGSAEKKSGEEPMPEEAARPEAGVPHQAELFAPLPPEEGAEAVEHAAEEAEEPEPPAEAGEPHAVEEQPADTEEPEEPEEPEEAEETEEPEEPEEEVFVLEPMRQEAPQSSRRERRKRALQQEALFDEEALSFAELDQAAELVLGARRPTPSMLQRQLDIDHARARQLLHALERRGAIAPPRGSGAWQPLCSFAGWVEATADERR